MLFFSHIFFANSIELQSLKIDLFVCLMKLNTIAEQNKTDLGHIMKSWILDKDTLDTT